MKELKGLGFGLGVILMVCWLTQAWNSGNWLGLLIFACLYFCLIIWEIVYTNGVRIKKQKDAERREEEKILLSKNPEEYINKKEKDWTPLMEKIRKH